MAQPQRILLVSSDPDFQISVASDICKKLNTTTITVATCSKASELLVSQIGITLLFVDIKSLEPIWVDLVQQAHQYGIPVIAITCEKSCCHYASGPADAYVQKPLLDTFSNIAVLKATIDKLCSTHQHISRCI